MGRNIQIHRLCRDDCVFLVVNHGNNVFDFNVSCSIIRRINRYLMPHLYTMVLSRYPESPEKYFALGNDPEIIEIAIEI